MPCSLGRINLCRCISGCTDAAPLTLLLQGCGSPSLLHRPSLPWGPPAGQALPLPALLLLAPRALVFLPAPGDPPCSCLPGYITPPAREPPVGLARCSGTSPVCPVLARGGWPSITAPSPQLPPTHRQDSASPPAVLTCPCCRQRSSCCPWSPCSCQLWPAATPAVTRTAQSATGDSGLPAQLHNVSLLLLVSRSVITHHPQIQSYSSPIDPTTTTTPNPPSSGPPEPVQGSDPGRRPSPRPVPASPGGVPPLPRPALPHLPVAGQGRRRLLPEVRRSQGGK